MKNPDNRAFLYDIDKSINQIQSYANNVSKEEFMNNQLLQDAILRQLEIIGEAANRVTKDFASNHPNLPWSKMAGLRHRLIHDYTIVDLEAVWQVVNDDLKPLKKQIQELL